MKTLLLTILTGLFVIHVQGQVSFSPVDSKLKTQKSTGSTELVCTGPTISVKFRLKSNVAVLRQNNFATVDGQTIQIIPLKFSGLKKSTKGQNTDEEKKLLDLYTQYELEYFKNELRLDVVNPNNQWVVTKSKGWFIWYFRVGNPPTNVDRPTTIQLFASTVIGDKILTINAPIQSDGDFNKAALIVNEMMETIIITKQ